MTEQEAYSIVMQNHHWSSAHLLCKEVCRILQKEVREILEKSRDLTTPKKSVE